MGTTYHITLGIVQTNPPVEGLMTNPTLETSTTLETRA